MDTSVIIVAAGASARMNGVNKQLALLDEVPVIIRSVRAFDACESVRDIVVAVRAEDAGEITALCRRYGIAKPVTVITGGPSRRLSVQSGLSAVCADTAYIAIHDGARPLITPELIERVLSGARRYGACAPGVPVKETIKVAGEDSFVLNTPPRCSLFAAQTPQAFRRDIYALAVAAADDFDTEPTDDCQMVEAAGCMVYLSPGEYRNLKITTPEDLAIAEAILGCD